MRGLKKITMKLVTLILVLQFFIAPSMTIASASSADNSCLRVWQPFETFYQDELIVHNGQVFRALQPVFTDHGDPNWAPGVISALWQFVGYVEDFCPCYSEDEDDPIDNDCDEYGDDDYGDIVCDDEYIPCEEDCEVDDDECKENYTCQPDDDEYPVDDDNEFNDKVQEDDDDNQPNLGNINNDYHNNYPDFEDNFYYQETDYLIINEDNVEIVNLYLPAAPVIQLEWDIPVENIAMITNDVLRVTVAEEITNPIVNLTELPFLTAINLTQTYGLPVVVIAQFSLVITSFATVLVVIKIET